MFGTESNTSLSSMVATTTWGRERYGSPVTQSAWNASALGNGAIQIGAGTLLRTPVLGEALPGQQVPLRAVQAVRMDVLEVRATREETAGRAVALVAQALAVLDARIEEKVRQKMDAAPSKESFLEKELESEEQIDNFTGL